LNDFKYQIYFWIKIISNDEVLPDAQRIDDFVDWLNEYIKKLVNLTIKYFKNSDKILEKLVGM